jgi:hypothetical protein
VFAEGDPWIPCSKRRRYNPKDIFTIPSTFAGHPSLKKGGEIFQVLLCAFASLPAGRQVCGKKYSPNGSIRIIDF